VSFRGTTALDGVTLSVKPRERLAIIGASGAGKTTLFRTLIRGVALSGGRVTVGGRDLYSLSKSDLKAVRRRIGSIYQAYNLVPQLSAGVNVALGEVGGMNTVATLRTFLAGPDTTLASRVTDALERVGLGDRLDHEPSRLSGGEQQRVAIARALMNRGTLLIADEPTGNLDAETGKQIMSVFEQLHRDHGQTVVMVTHDRSLARRADRVLILRDGKIERAAEVAHE